MKSKTGDLEQTTEDILEYNELCDMVEQQLEALDDPTTDHTFECI